MLEAAQLEGARVLVGVTREHNSGDVSHEQFAGIATVSDHGDYCLVSVDCSAGEVRHYPFDARTIEKATPGNYRLRSTGEIVTNPDFLMTWVVAGGHANE